MKNCLKIGAVVLVLTILLMEGIQPEKAKADSITIAGNMLLNEVKDVDIGGHHYDAILFRVSQNVVNNQTYVILHGLKTSEDSLIIPAYIEGIPVKEIKTIQDSTLQYGTKCFSRDNQGYYLWSENSSKKYDTITIPSTITHIDGLKNVKAKKLVIPETVEYFGGGNQLEQVQIKGKSTEIGSSAFAGGLLNKISLPKGYQGKIGSDAFARTQLTSFRWPAYKKDIKNKLGMFLLSGCKKLKKVTFETGTKQVYIPESCFEDCSKMKKLVFPKSLKKVIYGWHEYAGNYNSKAPKTLVFEGKNTKLQGLKAGKYLSDVINDDESAFENKPLLMTGKIVAPKKSQAIKYAKKAYYVKKILKRLSSPGWRDRGKKGFKLAKIKWSYSK